MVELGHKLFFDRRLSINNTMSCGMCHIEAQAFTSNQLGSSVGMEGRSLKRNAPSLFNVAYETSLFRDGRETHLETQAWAPILDHHEIAAPSIGWVLDRIESLPNYKGSFEEAFPGRGISMNTVGEALAAYERSLLLGNSRFDRWRYGGEDDALTAEEQRGFALFTGKAGCSGCHTISSESALLSDGKFHDTGLGYTRTMDRGKRHDRHYKIQLAPGTYTSRSEQQLSAISNPIPNDLGRYEVTRDPADRWTFKTPTLRNVAITGPYMHDGSFGTLMEVVEYYDRGGDYSPNKSGLVQPLNLDDGDKQALVAFLKSLTGERPANEASADVADKYKY